MADLTAVGTNGNQCQHPHPPPPPLSLCLCVNALPRVPRSQGTQQTNSKTNTPFRAGVSTARSGEPATPRSHRPRCAGSATLKHLNSGSYRWVCPASPPSPMRVPNPEPSSPSCTPPAPPRRLFGGHFGHFACAAGGTKCYIWRPGHFVRPLLDLPQLFLPKINLSPRAMLIAQLTMLAFPRGTYCSRGV
eukprot:COSAG06_NODE_573_length_14086_cov_30.835633_6_plen_190_part_00